MHEYNEIKKRAEALSAKGVKRYEALEKRLNLGEFMAKETATDLEYAQLLNRVTENTKKKLRAKAAAYTASRCINVVAGAMLGSLVGQGIVENDKSKIIGGTIAGIAAGTALYCIEDAILTRIDDDIADNVAFGSIVNLKVLETMDKTEL